MENIDIKDSEIRPEMTFRHLVYLNMQKLTNFPYIEKDFDALTDYQLLCLVVKYLNDVIENSNKQNESIMNLYNAFLELQTYMNNQVQYLEDEWNDKTHELEEDWLEKTTEIETAFNQLHDYVQNYFDNLDVQEEIDNKLDEMLEQGVLEQIIEQFIQSTALWCFDTVSDMKAATNLINGSYAKTMGFYASNDGGSGTYKIRTKTNEDTPNEMELIAIGTTLVAQLIFDDEVNVLQLGAKPDGSTDNTDIFQHGIDLAYKLTKPLYIPTGKNNRYILENSLVINLDNDSEALTIHGDLFNTNFKGTWINYTTIICHSDFITGYDVNTNVDLTMYNLSIGFQDTTLENPDYNYLAVFKNIQFSPLKLRHCLFAALGYFIYNGNYHYVSEIYDNTFYGVNRAWVKTYSSDTSSLLSRHYLSDSLCNNNYIHGNRHTNPILIDGICDDDSRLENNFIDFFKFLFTCDIPNVNVASFGILSKNLFSRCFRITNRVIQATFIENNFQAWTRTIINSDFDNQDTFMQNCKVGAFICDPADLTYDANYKEEYRNTKIINNKIYAGVDYFMWFSGTTSTSSNFMMNLEEKGTIAIGGDAETFDNKIGSNYFYIRALSLSSQTKGFHWKIGTIDYIDLSSEFATAPNNPKQQITYDGNTYSYFMCRNNQHVWLGDGLYIGKYDASASGDNKWTLVKLS